MIQERDGKQIPGYGPLFLGLAVMAGSIFMFIQGVNAGLFQILAAVLVFVISFIFLTGLFVVNPNEAKVLQIFGDYAGTANKAGLRWANPFYTKRKVSVRVRNFETGKLKVNDNAANPIEIGCVVVWRVMDTAEALFNVNDFEDFVHVQSEAALRNLATGYPYVSHEGEMSLSGNTAEVSKRLREEIHERLAQAGVEVLEARISHLAYAQEIAAAMLQRQQAGAIIAARQRIVEGAVGMVEMALHQLSEKSLVTLDDERRAAMVSNLLVVLCGERGAQPIVNTGTIYQ
jgi:regulator of protease activity HflC (stomatin/prohibitin superfamily)